MEVNLYFDVIVNHIWNHSDLVTLMRGQRGSESFSKNSRKLFQELISTCDDNFNPIYIFSSEELRKATNNYSELEIILKDGDYNLYKGVQRNRSLIVKKFKDGAIWIDDPIKEIVFSSVFSSHSSVLKLLGCCLETECPILVFENAENGTLANNIVGSSLSWKCRVRIAMELCEAVAYLHNNFHYHVVHRDIRTASILLDRDNSGKLFNFSLSLAIPDDESEAEDAVRGTIGYVAPEYLRTGCFNEKIDVYSVGVVMLQLLTGQTPYDLSRLEGEDDVLLVDFVRQHIREDRFNSIVDRAIWDEGLWPGKHWQLKVFASIALRCLSNVEERPAIVEVARQLSELHKICDAFRDALFSSVFSVRPSCGDAA